MPEELSYLTPVDDAEAAFVARLASHLGGAATTLVGEGFGNWVWRLERANGPAALKVGKPHRIAFIAAEHRKELWAANAAGAAGVPTPAALAAGVFEGRSYLVQSLVSGRQALPDEGARIWPSLGAWARTIHTIPVSGWGPHLAGDGAFDGEWAAHLAYNIGELGPADPLLTLGVLDAALSGDLKRRFQRLAAARFHIGLCHGDLAQFNVLIDNADGALTLIDWGCAFAGPVPYYEVNEMLRSARATADELEQFRRGYGLDDAAWTAVRADLPDLLALREVDTLRWGLEHRQEEVETLARRARRALAALR